MHRLEDLLSAHAEHRDAPYDGAAEPVGPHVLPADYWRVQRVANGFVTHEANSGGTNSTTEDETSSLLVPSGGQNGTVVPEKKK